MKSTPIGPRRFRLTVELNTPTPDTVNEPADSWSAIATIWASLRQTTTRDAAYAERLQVVATHVIECRAEVPLTVLDHRLTMAGRVFNLRDVNDVDERHRHYIILAEEVKNAR